MNSDEARTSQVSSIDPIKPDLAPKPSALPFYDGLTTMSPTLIKQAIFERLDLGLKTELEVSKHMTVLYGGLLMGNASLVEQHWPLAGSTRTPAQPTHFVQGPTAPRTTTTGPPYALGRAPTIPNPWTPRGSMGCTHAAPGTAPTIFPPVAHFDAGGYSANNSP